jgi:RNA polymerase sigma-70 factor (ECF subfamily)
VDASGTLAPSGGSKPQAGLSRVDSETTSAHPFAHDQGVRWMLAYQQGSEPAFDRLVETYSGQVWSLLTRFLGAVPEREDLLQEVFLRVVRARERYRPEARFTTFLYRIAFNLALNLGERARTAHAERETDTDRPQDAPDPRGEEPSSTLEREDVVQAVRDAIAALPETQRMALILARYEELPYSEIALVLHSSEKAVKSLIHRARENLRARLAPFMTGLAGEKERP